MNPFSIFSAVLNLVPYVVAGIEHIHSAESTETKTQLAQDTLAIATKAASTVLSPGNQQIATALSGAVNASIANVQSVLALIKNPPPATSSVTAPVATATTTAS